MIRVWFECDRECAEENRLHYTVFDGWTKAVDVLLCKRHAKKLTDDGHRLQSEAVDEYAEKAKALYGKAYTVPVLGFPRNQHGYMCVDGECYCKASISGWNVGVHKATYSTMVNEGNAVAWVPSRSGAVVIDVDVYSLEGLSALEKKIQDAGHGIHKYNSRSGKWHYILNSRLDAGHVPFADEDLGGEIIGLNYAVLNDVCAIDAVSHFLSTEEVSIDWHSLVPELLLSPPLLYYSVVDSPKVTLDFSDEKPPEEWSKGERHHRLFHLSQHLLPAMRKAKDRESLTEAEVFQALQDINLRLPEPQNKKYMRDLTNSQTKWVNSLDIYSGWTHEQRVNGAKKWNQMRRDMTSQRDMAHAYQAIKVDGLSYRKAEKKLGIPYTTMYRWLTERETECAMAHRKYVNKTLNEC